MEVVEVPTKVTVPTEAVVVTSNTGGELDVSRISVDNEQPSKKRGRGRPPKIARPDANANSNTAVDSIPNMASSSGEDVSTAMDHNTHESPGIAAIGNESTGTSGDAISTTGKGSDSGKAVTKDNAAATAATKGGKKNAKESNVIVEKESGSTRDSIGSSGKKEKEEKGKNSARLSISSTTSITSAKTPTTTSSKKEKGSRQSKEEEEEEPRRSKRGR